MVLIQMLLPTNRPAVAGAPDTMPDPPCICRPSAVAADVRRRPVRPPLMQCVWPPAPLSRCARRHLDCYVNWVCPAERHNVELAVVDCHF
jgi:hypothetical protein